MAHVVIYMICLLYSVQIHSVLYMHHPGMRTLVGHLLSRFHLRVAFELVDSLTMFQNHSGQSRDWCMTRPRTIVIC